MMTVALWVIAICSIVRIVQNGIQLSMLIGERDLRKQLNNEFIDSLRKDNKEWATEVNALSDQIVEDIDTRVKCANAKKVEDESQTERSE